MSATFAPKRLGAATTVTFTLSIDPPAEVAPPPLTSIRVSYPEDLGFATSGLGLAACQPVALEVDGGQACPPNSKVGSGSAIVEVPFGPSAVQEHVGLEMFAGPSPDGYLHLLMLARGSEPVLAKILLSAVLLPGHLQITVPPIGGLPGGPDVSIASMKARLGGPLTYYEHVHGRLVAYRPRGIALPDRCPRGGWRLGARLAFVGGAQSRAVTAVPCPRR
jgi:hypothetical protein